MWAPTTGGADFDLVFRLGLPFLEAFLKMDKGHSGWVDMHVCRTGEQTKFALRTACRLVEPRCAMPSPKRAHTWLLRAVVGGGDA